MKRTIRIIQCLIVSLMALIVIYSNGYAQSHPKQGLSESSQDVELTKLGLSADTSLQGSFDEAKITFSIPSTWVLESGGAIDLDITNNFSALIAGQTASTPVNINVGELSVWLNDQIVGSKWLKESGDFSYSIKIDEKYFRNRTETRLNELVIRWDSNVSCNIVASMVSINPTSKLHLVYQNLPAPVILEQFPSPFYRDHSINPQKVSFVVADQPSEAELQAVMNMAAGFGKFSNGNMSINLIPFGHLADSEKANTNLIFVGTTPTLNNINNADFKKLLSNQFSSITASDDDGIIIETESPWDSTSVLLIVTGKNEIGLSKAATAVSTGKLIPSSDSNSAVIKEILIDRSANEEKTDISFSDLNQKTEVINNFGKYELEIPFTIPKSRVITPESYLDLYLNHSKLIDYDQSGLWVKINEIPIGSVRFSDQTSDTTLVRFIIPPSAIKSIYNKLTIETNLVSRNICTTPNIADHWITIFGDSYLHIPAVQETNSLASALSIGDYPQPFAMDEGLSAATFLLKHNDLTSWKIASSLAFNLGSLLKYDSYHMQVSFPESLNILTKKGQELIIIGLANQIPFSTKLNDLLPVSFNSDGSIKDEEKLQISYAVQKDQPLGYLEMINLPYTLQSNILFISGSNEEGLTRASEILLDRSLRDQLQNSNFVLVQKDKFLPENIKTGNTIPIEAKENTSEKTSQSISISMRQWVWIGLIGVLALIIILIGTSIIQSIRNRK